jgi:hypothetical protein
MMAKVLIKFETLPTGSTLRTHATTVRLWTSKPARQRCNMSIDESPKNVRRTERHRGEEAICSTCSAGIASDAFGPQVWVRAMPSPDRHAGSKHQFRSGVRPCDGPRLCYNGLPVAGTQHLATGIH